MSYQLLTQDSQGEARRGIFQTRRGQIDLPLFCPVATLGTLKSLDSDTLENLSVQMILANAYHLHLRPGELLIQKQGGLHSFMKWPFPILTDSGGYQVFSLSRSSVISDQGVEFRNHLDGDKIFMTPEKSMQIQWRLGADILMAFDHCPLGDISKDEAFKASERTYLWLKESHKSFLNLKQNYSTEKCQIPRPEKPPYFFGIVQGGIYEDLRERSLDQVQSLDLDGMALGGMSVGEDKENMYRILRFIGKKFPKNKIRYLMGVGEPEDLVHAVDCGFDLFDCVLPTRLARFGHLFTHDFGRINIRNRQYKEDTLPISEVCQCPVCKKGYSRSYLRHLFLSRELLSYHLFSLHNVYFYLRFMEDIRQALSQGKWAAFKKTHLK